MIDHSVTILNELVALEPKYLDSNILTHLKDNIKSSKIGKCTKDYGFIKDIDILSVKPTEISIINCYPQFLVNFVIRSIMPKQGSVYATQKIIAFEHSKMCYIIATIDETCEQSFRIFIINCISRDNNFYFSDCKCSIPKSKTVIDYVLSNIIVETVEYNDKQFIVTGKHIHDIKNDNVSSLMI